MHGISLSDKFNSYLSQLMSHAPVKTHRAECMFFSKLMIFKSIFIENLRRKKRM